MRRRAWILAVTLLAWSALLFAGCEKAPELPVLGGAFNTYWTSESGQVVRVRGYSEGHQAGSQAEFQVQFDNPLKNAPTWSDSYRVVLADPATGNEWEVARGEFDVQAWTANEFRVTVQFPPAVEGRLRLNVFTGSGGFLGVQVSVGETEPVGRPNTVSTFD